METINYETFARVAMKVGRVTSVEPVPGSNKLLKVTLDMGDHSRTVVAGIAQTHRPENLIGRSLIVLTNLVPRKLMGVMSEGMVLAAEDKQGNVYLLTTEREAPPGSKVL